MDRYSSPLLQVLLRVSEVAPPAPKSRLGALLLPSNEVRERVLGRGNSLSERLLKLSTISTALNLRELIPVLLFELSDRDVKSFVRNIGYGFASGFLFSKGIQLPPNALEEVEEEGSAMVDSQHFGVNPITGQRRDAEPRLHMPETTDQEKEREAERLFVLFQRLQETGVVNVENPVDQAMREGRFEEVD